MQETILSTLFTEYMLCNPSPIAFKFTKTREMLVYLPQLLTVPQIFTENLPDSMFVHIKVDLAKKIRPVTSLDLETTVPNLISEYTVLLIRRIE